MLHHFLKILLTLSIAAVGGPAIALDYTIVDTGQSIYYDNSTSIGVPLRGQAFYGQDAQYAGNQPSYTTSGDGLTVYDNNTGLTWQQGLVDSKMTFSEAQAYVTTLNNQSFGGYSDWRLPSIKELYSLIDFRGIDPNPTLGNSMGLAPFIDTNYFAFAYGTDRGSERIIDSQYVSSTVYTADNSMVFGVNFADGRIKGYGLSMPQSGLEKTFEVRLVRGNTAYGINDFSDNGQGIITDAATGLQWSKNDSGEGMDWEDALAWVQQKNNENYLGHNDWRLPNAKELQSIVDYTSSPDTTDSAAIAREFNCTEITNLNGDDDFGWYWTSTSHVRQGDVAESAVYIAFGRGLGTYDGSTIVDVHGAGCQRSDPKIGNPADYPSVFNDAPQGDVQRVFNYVRLVRDVDAVPEPSTVTLLVFGLGALLFCRHR